MKAGWRPSDSIAPVADEPAPIVCRALTRYYGSTVGIEDLDLVVRRGMITGFLGPNGAGKTTVLRLLVGLLRPTRGEAWIDGVPVGDPEARRRIGFMPAGPAFVGELTGAANLDLLADLSGAEPTDRSWAIQLLDFDSRDLDRPVKEYSSGMVQKLALIQAVQHRPDLVLLDERPTASIRWPTTGSRTWSDRLPPAGVPSCYPRTCSARSSPPVTRSRWYAAAGC